MSNSRATSDSFASLFEQSDSGKRTRRRVSVGEAVEATVLSIGRDAVFADIGGKQEGTFERIDLLDAGGQVRVEVGSKISAIVSGVDEVAGMVRLAPVVIRTAEADVGIARTSGPGAAAGPVLVQGARVKGKVTGIERYGVFVQIEGTFGRSGRGLVPTFETGTSRGADLKKFFTVGQDIETKILQIEENGRIRLSISALGADDERGMFEAYKAGTTGDEPAAAAPKAAGARPGPKEKPAPRNFGTLGDLLPKIAPKAAPKPAAPTAARPAGGPAKPKR